MKKTKIIKAILLILLFLLTCSLNLKVYAVSINSSTPVSTIQNALNNNQSITFDYPEIAKNKYVYCMQKSHLLSHGNNTFVKDTAYKILQYPYSSGEGHDWAYLFGKNYENYGSGATKFGDSYLQHAFWYALGNDGNLQPPKTPAASALPQSVNVPEKSFYGTVTQAFKTEKAMIEEAKSYKNYCLGLKSGSVQVSGPSEVKDLYENTDSEHSLYPYTYGPFYVSNLNHWIYNGELKTGIMEMEIIAIDDAGNSVKPNYILLQKSELGTDSAFYSQSGVKRWHGGDGTFKYDNDITDKNELKGLNQRLSNGQGFYIHFAQKLDSFKIKIKVQTIQASVNIYPIKSYTNSSNQKLIIANPTYKTPISNVTQNFTVYTPPTPPTQPVFTIDLKKCSINDLDFNDLKAPTRNIGNGIFTVTAKQNGVQVFKQTGVTSRVTIEGQYINAPIYISIAETEAPKGYEKINKNINFILSPIIQNGKVIRFDPTFRPTQEEWSDSGYNYGGWSWEITPFDEAQGPLESDQNDFPNLYKSSENDYIIVEDNETLGYYRIDIYDRINPIKLQLNKFSSYFDDEPQPLEGSKFRVVAAQRKGLSIIGNFAGLQIKTSTGGTSTNGCIENVNAEEEILIYPYFYNTEEIYIFIQEMEAPEGYRKLSKPITLVLELDEDTKEWVNPQIKLESMNYQKSLAAIVKKYQEGTPSINLGIDAGNDITNDESNIKYLQNIWSWVQKEDEYLGNNQYNSNLPNTYCIHERESEISEQTIIETTGIKDVISVDINSDEDGSAYILDIYNEPLTYNLPINLLKLINSNNGQDLEETTDAEFKISIKQKDDNNGYVINDVNKVMTDLHYDINTTSTNDIYIVIKETREPAKCKRITQPINIVYKYINRRWVASYVLTSQELQAVGFAQTDCGGWTVEEDTNDEFTNYTSSSGDGIKVSIDGTICVLNDKLAVFSKVTLLKVNKNDYKLPGAMFSGSISNIKSFKRGGVEYTPQSGNTFTFQNWELETGELSIHDVILEKPNEDLVIQITEDRPPEHYLNFADYVRIKLSYKNKTGVVEYGLSDVEDDLPVIVTFDDENVDEPSATIKIVNKKADAILQLSLLKLDKTTNLLLDGAAFAGTISNIVSFKDAEGNLKTANNQGVYSFDNWVLNNGTFEIYDVVIANKNNDVILEMHETAAPTGYNTIVGNITIKISYKNNSATVSYSNYQTAALKPVSIKTDTNMKEDMTVQLSIDNRPMDNSNVINIGGTVWKDGDDNFAQVSSTDGNGLMDAGEQGVSNVLVLLINDAGQLINLAVTDQYGRYSFEGLSGSTNGYMLSFRYDGINYKDTLYQKRINDNSQKNSSAKETEQDRISFNKKFYRIEENIAINKDNANSITDLNYRFIANNGLPKSIISITESTNLGNGNYFDIAKETFAMYAQTAYINQSSNNINFGLIPKCTDLSLTTNENSCTLRINEQEYYKPFDISGIEVAEANHNQSAPAYTLPIQRVDFEYKKGDFANIDSYGFNQNRFTDNVEPGIYQSGDELSIYVKYRLDLRNAGTATTDVRQIEYNYDSKYNFLNDETITENGYLGNIQGVSYTISQSANNKLIINFQSGMTIATNETKTMYLLFEIPRDVFESTSKFSNTAEITAYSSDEGVIDIDSQPGNLDYGTNNYLTRFEDDSCMSKGLLISIVDDNSRVFSGYVFEDVDGDSKFTSTDKKIDNVTVQLIELKKVSNKYVEGIWQETISGSNQGLRIKADGTGTETYEYLSGERETGKFEFRGFIPGTYIIRFIYGDGTSIDSDLNGEILKYNGQDYKSTIDKNYRAPYYVKEDYEENASVARDNESRRLETMAYAADVDSQKGLMLKLFDVNNVNDLNATEIKTLADMEPKTTVANPISLTADEITNLNSKIKNLQRELLDNTWMCAETSKINVQPAGFEGLYNMNFGIVERPKVTIELKKVITGFKLTANNGQTLVNATIPVDSYLRNATEEELIRILNNQISGIKNNVTVLGNKIQYEVGNPTELNTIIEGATLEFTYSVLAENKSEQDMLHPYLVSDFKSNSGRYVDRLKYYANNAKNEHRIVGLEARLGEFIGLYYYTGVNTGEQANVFEVAAVKDYINNDLIVKDKTQTVTQKSEPEDHYILNDNYNLTKISVNTVLEAKNLNNIIEKNETKQLFTVSLSPTHVLSAGGKKEFENYIAELIMYRNAAARRATYVSETTKEEASIVPGNAEIIDHEYRTGENDIPKTHELDEADTLRVEIGVATGLDKQTIFVYAEIIGLSLVIIGLGAFSIKKYILKK